ncbi:MAG: hypothetical protein INF91_08280 [Alphaproteobacteria bacterium]|nr:hypothetical protein [Alphaproteobacteria bacterium]
MRALASDAHSEMLRAIRGLCDGDPLLRRLIAAGPDGDALVIEGLASEAWRSVTFEGHRHRLELALRGDPATLGRAHDRLVATLGEADLPLRGRCVIDTSLADARTESDAAGERRRLVFELLTLED